MFTATVTLCPRRYTYSIIAHHWTAADKKIAAYIAANPHAASIPDLVCALVLHLVRKGHTIVMDSYFCYVTTVRRLLALGYNVVGSAKVTSGLPYSAGLMWNKKDTKMEFGSCRGLRSADGMIGSQQWKDTSVVTVMSTIHHVVSGTPTQVAELSARMQKPVTRMRKAINGVHSSHDSVQPIALAFYSAHMRYVCAFF